MSNLSTFTEARAASGKLEAEYVPQVNFEELSSVVVVPVAAHQESIEGIVEAYAETDLANTAVYLFLNAPITNMDDPTVAYNLGLLKKLIGQSKRSQFGGGLRLYDWGGVDGPFSMGKLRADGWLHLLEAAVPNGLSDDSIGFSHDADMLKVSKNLFSKSGALADKTPTHLQYTTVYWGLSEAETKDQPLPGLNRLSAYMTISEMALQLSTRIHRMWDFATAFRMGSYALSGGYDETPGPSEITPLLASIKTADGLPDLPLFTQIEDEFLVASMRRFVLGVAKDISPFDIDDPTIGPNDGVRTQELPLQVAERNARANLGDWCNQADDRNIATIIERFGSLDGDDVDLRIDLYEALANHGRGLMRTYAPDLNGTNRAAQTTIRAISGNITAKQKQLISN